LKIPQEQWAMHPMKSNIAISLIAKRQTPHMGPVLPKLSVWNVKTEQKTFKAKRGGDKPSLFAFFHFNKR
jgi:hypothetical protein